MLFFIVIFLFFFIYHVSFSDGGKYMAVENAIKNAKIMINEGANIIDIGKYHNLNE